MDYRPIYLVNDDPNYALWLDPDLVEFVDHTPGTTARIGNRSFTRSAGGEWIEDARVDDDVQPGQ